MCLKYVFSLLEQKDLKDQHKPNLNQTHFNLRELGVQGKWFLSGLNCAEKQNDTTFSAFIV